MDFDAIARQIMINHYAAYPDPERQTMAFIADELRKAYVAGRVSMREEARSAADAISDDYRNIAERINGRDCDAKWFEGGAIGSMRASDAIGAIDAEKVG